MSIRIGKKIGKKTFVSLGKSGTYVSTWIGGYRFSKFNPSRKTKKTETKADPQYDNLDLSGSYLGTCMTGAILAVLSFFPVVWLFSSFNIIPITSILAGIISVFVVYWLWWTYSSYKHWNEETLGDIVIMFFTPFFSFLSLMGLITWAVMIVLGMIIVLW